MTVLRVAQRVSDLALAREPSGFTEHVNSRLMDDLGREFVRHRALNHGELCVGELVRTEREFNYEREICLSMPVEQIIREAPSPAVVSSQYIHTPPDTWGEYIASPTVSAQRPSRRSSAPTRVPDATEPPKDYKDKEVLDKLIEDNLDYVMSVIINGGKKE